MDSRVVQTIRQPVNRAAELAKAQLQDAERRLREKFGGYDLSQTKEARRARELARFRHLFELLDVRGRKVVAIDDFEDLFGTAQLHEARTEVGHLAYDADADGNGALDFPEFVAVMDALAEYHKGSDFSLQRMGDNLRGQATAEEGSFLFGTEGAAMSMRQVVYHTFDDPTFSPLSRVVAGILFTAILLAVLVFVLQSEPAFDGFAATFAWLEAFCLLVFMADYGTRLVTAPSLKRFLLSPANFLDLLTILPYFLDEVNEAFHPRGGYGAAMRILRIFRVLRVFRITKYIPYVNLMTAAVRDAVAPLAMAMLVLSVGVILLAMAAFYSERGAWDADRLLWLQPDGTPSAFQGVGTAVYWTIVTLTTLGYGDVFPTSPMGQLVGSITALSGCVIISFPVAIYSDEFSKQYGGFIKSRALQQELGDANLVRKLIAARLEELQRPEFARFPPKHDIRDHRSPAVPRNLSMYRWAKQLEAIGRARGWIVDEPLTAGPASGGSGSAAAAGGGGTTALSPGSGGGGSLLSPELTSIGRRASLRAPRGSVAAPGTGRRHRSGSEGTADVLRRLLREKAEKMAAAAAVAMGAAPGSGANWSGAQPSFAWGPGANLVGSFGNLSAVSAGGASAGGAGLPRVPSLGIGLTRLPSASAAFLAANASSAGANSARVPSSSSSLHLDLAGAATPGLTPEAMHSARPGMPHSGSGIGIGLGMGTQGIMHSGRAGSGSYLSAGAGSAPPPPPPPPPTLLGSLSGLPSHTCSSTPGVPPAPPAAVGSSAGGVDQAVSISLTRSPRLGPRPSLTSAAITMTGPQPQLAPPMMSLTAAATGSSSSAAGGGAAAGSGSPRLRSPRLASIAERTGAALLSPGDFSLDSSAAASRNGSGAGVLTTSAGSFQDVWRASGSGTGKSPRLDSSWEAAGAAARARGGIGEEYDVLAAGEGMDDDGDDEERALFGQDALAAALAASRGGDDGAGGDGGGGGGAGGDGAGFQFHGSRHGDAHDGGDVDGDVEAGDGHGSHTHGHGHGYGASAVSAAAAAAYAADHSGEFGGPGGHHPHHDDATVAIPIMHRRRSASVGAEAVAGARSGAGRSGRRGSTTTTSRSLAALTAAQETVQYQRLLARLTAARTPTATATASATPSGSGATAPSLTPSTGTDVDRAKFVASSAAEAAADRASAPLLMHANSFSAPHGDGLPGGAHHDDAAAAAAAGAEAGVPMPAPLPHPRFHLQRHDEGALGRIHAFGRAGHAASALEEEERDYKRLLGAARRALVARRIAAVARVGGAGAGGSGTAASNAAAAAAAAGAPDPWLELVLLPASFSLQDLTDDGELESAILQLLSDRRKRIWTEIRALEARFRDDLSMELARRWSRWMNMPLDYAVDVSRPYIFRKRELNAAMLFRRESLGLGAVFGRAGAGGSGSFSGDAGSATGSPGYTGFAERPGTGGGEDGGDDDDDEDHDVSTGAGSKIKRSGSSSGRKGTMSPRLSPTRSPSLRLRSSFLSSGSGSGGAGGAGNAGSGRSPAAGAAGPGGSTTGSPADGFALGAAAGAVAGATAAPAVAHAAAAATAAPNAATAATAAPNAAATTTTPGWVSFGATGSDSFGGMVGSAINKTTAAASRTASVASAAATRTATALRDLLPEGMQPQVDLAGNYQARLASRYADVLGEEGAAQLRAARTASAASAAGGGSRSGSLFGGGGSRAGSSSWSSATGASASRGGRRGGGGGDNTGDDDLDSDATGGDGSTGGSGGGGGGGGGGGYVRTAFGLSHVPKSLPVVHSSLGAGTASIFASAEEVAAAAAVAAGASSSAGGHGQVAGQGGSGGLMRAGSVGGALGSLAEGGHADALSSGSTGAAGGEFADSASASSATSAASGSAVPGAAGAGSAAMPRVPSAAQMHLARSHTSGTVTSHGLTITAPRLGSGGSSGSHDGSSTAAAAFASGMARSASTPGVIASAFGEGIGLVKSLPGKFAGLFSLHLDDGHGGDGTGIDGLPGLGLTPMGNDDPLRMFPASFFGDPSSAATAAGGGGAGTPAAAPTAGGVLLPGQTSIAGSGGSGLPRTGSFSGPGAMHAHTHSTAAQRLGAIHGYHRHSQAHAARATAGAAVTGEPTAPSSLRPPTAPPQP